MLNEENLNDNLCGQENNAENPDLMVIIPWGNQIFHHTQGESLNEIDDRRDDPEDQESYCRQADQVVRQSRYEISEVLAEADSCAANAGCDVGAAEEFPDAYLVGIPTTVRGGLPSAEEVEPTRCVVAPEEDSPPQHHDSEGDVDREI